ncbi:hypothetical protein D0B32_02565 [Paraburkholderia sp. DHOC27]|nr:hypothetical protein D0B32_02565 [Paraburkholderia sp. DHOC27]
MRLSSAILCARVAPCEQDMRPADAASAPGMSALFLGYAFHFDFGGYSFTNERNIHMRTFVSQGVETLLSSVVSLATRCLYPLN